MSAKEMLIEMDCKYMETKNGIWIDENVVYYKGNTGNIKNKISDSSRLCMIDKINKEIIFQDDRDEHKLNIKLFNAIAKLIEELGWNK